jgi:hypothetical protein
VTRFRNEEFEEFRDVKFGDVTRSGKAIKCTFFDGSVRFVPLSQIEDGCDPQPDTSGTLSVTSWLVGQWAEEESTGGAARANDRSATVSIPNVVALRETTKGLQVRAGDVEVWLAKSQVPEASEVRFDGDRGTLLLPRWIAEEKGLVESSKQRTVADDVDDLPAPEDDIPF